MSTKVNDDILNDQKLLTQDEDLTTDTNEKKEFKEYPYRWVIFTIYIIPNMVSAAMWITCSPIVLQITQEYDVSNLIVNIATLCFPILYVILNFPAIFIIDDYGLIWGVLIGTTCTILGLVARCFIQVSFAFVIVGQILGGIGQPFLLNCPAKVATNWFGQKSRPIITGILALSNPIGTGIGFVFPGIIVSDDSSKTQIFHLMLYEAIIFGVLCIPTMFLFRKAPPTPPSLGAETKKVEFKHSIKQLFKNKNFVCIFITFSMIIGNFNCIATMVGQFVTAFKFKPWEGSVFGVTVVIFGLVGGAVSSILLMKTRKYYLINLIFCIFGLVTFALLFGLVATEIFALTLLGCAAFGFFNIALIPISIDFGCEVSFPLGEALINGTLVSSAQLLSILQVLLYSSVFISKHEDTGKTYFKGSSVIYANLVGGVLVVIGIIAAFFVKEDLKRINQENAGNSSNAVESLQGVTNY